MAFPARIRFQLPEDSALALLVAGFWRAGPVERVATEIAESGVAVPVVVCGRNEVLAEALRGTAADSGAPVDRGPAATRRSVVPRTATRPRLPLRTANRGRPRITVPVMAVTVAITLVMGIGAPLADAYGDVPGRFGAVAHFLDGDRR